MGTDSDRANLSNRRTGRSAVERLQDRLGNVADVLRQNRLGKVGVGTFGFFLLLGVFGPYLAPYDPTRIHRAGDGSALRLAEPSLAHPFGTTNLGRDVLSQVIIGARISILVGVLAAFIAVFIGVNIGLISGYFGGWVDDVLMRLTDIAYGLPFLPFVLVLVFLLGPSLWSIAIVISVLLWRSTARVIRSQVLSHKERPYVESARSIGASDMRIMYYHILPNVIPLAFLYGSFSVAWAVIAEASISFLGFGDPSMTSWGQILFNAYSAGAIRSAWWWVIPPGVCIMLLVMSVFFIGRALEELTNPELRHSQ